MARPRLSQHHEEKHAIGGRDTTVDAPPSAPGHMSRAFPIPTSPVMIDSCMPLQGSKHQEVETTQHLIPSKVLQHRTLPPICPPCPNHNRLTSSRNHRRQVKCHRALRVTSTRLRARGNLKAVTHNETRYRQHHAIYKQGLGSVTQAAILQHPCQLLGVLNAMVPGQD